jgi:phosphatidylglycerophosphatase A
MKNGFGVMLDDVLAGIYTSIILLAIIVFVNYE